MTHEYSIGTVARRTGLTPALIRMWESRYGAVTPGRSAAGQRRYSEGDIERLVLLKALTDAGHRISLIANSSVEELKGQLETLRAPSLTVLGGGAEPEVEAALEALAAMDRDRFRETLDHAVVGMGRIKVLDDFFTPLMREIGVRSADGRLRMSHEHLASAEVRGVLDGISAAFPPAPGAPALVVGTPVWQFHELGSLLVAATARAEGWRVTYLGPNLPANELAAASLDVDARAIALSVSFVEDRDQVLDELRLLRRLLPEGVEVIIGGRAAPELLPGLDDLGLLHRSRLSDLREDLARLRSSRMAG